MIAFDVIPLQRIGGQAKALWNNGFNLKPDISPFFSRGLMQSTFHAFI